MIFGQAATTLVAKRAVLDMHLVASSFSALS